MDPSLDGSYLRIERAGQHVDALRHTQEEIAVQDPVSIPTEPARPPERQPDGSWATFSPGFRVPDLSNFVNPFWSIWIGEAVYNLRAALDYMIYSLAHLDSGKEQERTQFPICSTVGNFQNAIRRGNLNGLNPAHTVAIEDLQPYRGGRWLEVLASVSNPDKHKHLIPSRAPPSGIISGTMNLSGGDAKPEPSEMVVQFSSTRVILFADGTPVVLTLDALRSHVTDVINQFRPEFGP